MGTENPLWNPLFSQECDHPPPSYEEACFHPPQPLTRVVTLVTTPVRGGAILAVPIIGSNTSNDELPPSYEQATSFSEQQQFSSAPLEVIPIQEIGLRTDNYYNTGNFGGTPATTFWSFAVGREIISSERCKRQVFVRNVYAIVTAQLLTTTLIISAFLYYATQWTTKSSSFYIALFLIFFTLSLTFGFASCACYYCSLNKNSPGRIVCLVVYTMTLGLLLAIVSASLRDMTILLTVIITAIVCLALTIFGANLARCAGILLVVGMVLVIFPFLLLLWENVFPFTNLVCACLAALIFSAFLVYDTQLMAMGKHREGSSISWNDYVFAVHTFHIDLMVIWICLCPRKCF